MHLPVPDPPLSDGVVTLRLPEERDLPAIERGITDPDVIRWIGPYEDTARQALDRNHALWNDGSGATFSICDPSGDCVGHIWFDINGSSQAEVGYWLLPEARGRGLATFTVGVFVIYLAGGIVLLLGPGPALIAALHRAGPRFESAVEVLIGLVALGLAIVAWRSRVGTEEEPRQRRFENPASAFALGAGISAIELPTAFLYFGVVTAILNSSAGTGAEVGLVVVYNALFVLPLVAIIALRTRIRDQLAAVMAWTWRSGRLVLVGITAVVGAGLVGLGLSGLL